MPPDGFLYLDLNHYIVDKKHTPLLYHVPRHCRDKKIKYNPNNYDKIELVYDRNITKLDQTKLKNFDYFKEKKKKLINNNTQYLTDVYTNRTCYDTPLLVFLFYKVY